MAIQNLQNLSLPMVALTFSVIFTGPLEVIDEPLIVHNPKSVSHCTEVWNEIAYYFRAHFNMGWYSKCLLFSALLAAMYHWISLNSCWFPHKQWRKKYWSFTVCWAFLKMLYIYIYMIYIYLHLYTYINKIYYNFCCYPLYFKNKNIYYCYYIEKIRTPFFFFLMWWPT